MISIRAVLRSALTRFFPTSLFVMAVGLTPLILSGAPGLNRWAPLIALSQVAGGTLGFAAVLMTVRRRLRADAPLDGRPAIVAGVVAPIVNMLALMVVGSPHKSRLLDMAACAAGGAVLAIAMFFPWLSRRPASIPDAPGSTAHLDSDATALLGVGPDTSRSGTRRDASAPVRLKHE